jgi:hypothetical protein
MAARRRKSPKPGAARRTASGKRKRAAAGAKPARRPSRKPSGGGKAGATTPARTPQPRAGASEPLVAGAPIEVGVVLHYYPRAAAAVVSLSRPIHRGDTIHVRGQTTDFVQAVEELALEGAPVAEGAPPQQIGVRFSQRARAGDRVYRVSW